MSKTENVKRMRKQDVTPFLLRVLGISNGPLSCDYQHFFEGVADHTVIGYKKPM